MFENRGLTEILIMVVSYAKSQFYYEEIENCEDCSCKWSRKEASFSVVKTEAHTVGTKEEE